MSTILDALRKVEAEQRTRTADARVRLLAFPPQSTLPRRVRFSVSWIVSAGLVLVGFASGTGWVVWGPRTDFPGQSQQAGQISPASEEPPGRPVLSLPDTRPLRSVPQTVAEATPSPAELVSAQGVAHRSPRQSEQQEEAIGEDVSKDVSLVQRSPFVSSASRDRTSSPAPRPATTPPAPLSHLTPLPSRDRPPVVSLSRPPSTPAPPKDASLSFLQWSPDPNKRIAFIKVNNGPLTLVHEGDTVAGLTVVAIRPDTVELRSGEERITLRVR